MKHNIRKIWSSALEVMAKNPVVIMPFVFIAFLESLSLEFIYFSARTPISFIANPIVKKFFGETFIHYPDNMVLLPRLFYYQQIAIYIFAGVFLAAISVNIFKNVKEGLPVRTGALIKNALRNYFSFFVYGIIIITLIFSLQWVNTFALSKFFRLLAKFLHYTPQQIFYPCLMILSFLTNVILQVFLILTVPVMVIEKKPLLKALWKSVSTGFQKFFTIFGIIFLPFLAYLPVTLLKGFSANLADKTFPEINVCVVVLGIVMSIFLDCFVIVSVSQWLLNNRSQSGSKESVGSR